MRLQLEEHGQRVFDAWLARNPSETDRRLVAGVLRAVQDRTWYRRGWHYHHDLADDGESIAVIQPRAGLQVAVQLWTDSEHTFDLLCITCRP